MKTFLREQFRIMRFGRLLVAVTVLSGIVGFLPKSAGGAGMDERHEKKDRIVTKWKELYGPADFAEQHFFECMTYLHPQPKSAFRDFQGVKLADRTNVEFQLWLREFFKGSFYESLKNLKPSKYYLNEGRTEASLLLYETNFEHNSITMIENYNVLFLTIKPTAFVAGRGIGGPELAKMLFDWINVRYQSVDEVTRGFGLPASLKLGDVFTNKSQPEIGLIGDWKDYILGFVSNEGVCLMLFKAQGGRAAMGFGYDFNWLNKGLYKEDGKTLVDPPRNEFSNDPYKGHQERKTK